MMGGDLPEAAISIVYLPMIAVSVTGVPAQDVTVILVTHNSGRHIAACLDTLPEGPVIVIDNASEDDSVGLTIATRPSAHVIRSRTNIGFACAVNRASQDAATPFILLLNPDTKLQADTILRLVTAAVNHPEFAILGALAIGPDGHPIITCARKRPSTWSVFSTALALRAIFPNSVLFDREALRCLSAPASGIQPADMVAGACMLVRTDSWRRLSGFDERYFMYGEDADLSVRAAKLGMGTALVPGAVYRHTVGGSARSRSAMLCQLFSAQVTYNRLHGRGLLPLTIGPLLQLHCVLRFVVFSFASLMSARAGEARAVWAEVLGNRREWLSGYTASVCKPATMASVSTTSSGAEPDRDPY